MRLNFAELSQEIALDFALCGAHDIRISGNLTRGDRNHT
jgi:hypothetical protein